MNKLKTSIVLELIDKATAPIKQVKSSLSHLGRAERNITKSTVAYSQKLKENTRLANKNTQGVSKQSDMFKRLGSSLLGIGIGLGITHKLKSILSTGKDIEKLNLNLATILNVDMASSKLKGFSSSLQKFSETGLASYADMANTSYSLLSAGLSKNEALEGAKIASKVALITRGNGEEVANVMATASKDFHRSMGTVGDVLAKTQAKFQIANFGQLEEGFKYVASSASALNISLEQTATVIGTLNDAGQAGSMAGTGFSSIINRMEQVATKINVKIPKLKDGSLDIIKWSKQVSEKVKSIAGPDTTKQFALLTKLFRIEGARSFLVLANRSKELTESLNEVTEGSKNFVRDQSLKYANSFGGHIKALSSSFTGLSVVLANAVIPSLIKLMDFVKPIIVKLAHFLQTHKLLTKSLFIGAFAIGTLVASLGTLKILSLFFNPLKMFSSLVMLVGRSSIITRTALVALRLGMIGLRIASLATGGVLALLFSPITLIIGAVAALGYGAYELIKHWKSVKTWFGSMFKWFAEKWNKIMGPITKMWGHVKSFFGGTTKIKQEVNHSFKQANTTPKLADKIQQARQQLNSQQGSKHSTKNVVVNHHNTFNIQGNNLNHEQITNTIMSKLKQQQKLSMAH